MNNKGFSAIAGIILVVTAVIGVVLVDQVNAPLWQTTANVNETVSASAVNGTSYTLTQCTGAITQMYDWTNGSIVPSYQYTLVSGTNTVTLGTPNDATNRTGTILGANYTGYDCSSYLSDSTARTVMEYFIVIVAVIVLALGGSWLYFKG